MASIEMSTHLGSRPSASAEQDLVVSASEPLATDTSLNNPASLPSSGADDLNADPGWLRHTEIRTTPLTLAPTLLSLILAVIYGTSTWIQSSTAADSSAKANRLALFTACISFPEQPNIINSNFCRENRDASLDGFAKRDVAAMSLPVLWDMDVLAAALEIVQPAWECKAVCGQERVLHPPDLALVFSIPISNGENCHLDCVKPIELTHGQDRGRQRTFNTLVVVILFLIISPAFPRSYPIFHEIAMSRTVLSNHHIINCLLRLETARLGQDNMPHSFSLHRLNRGPLNTNTALLLVAHFIGLNL
ncbi:uncharacterized protein EAE98_002335 [Botrytis deweyae]|uniref:Uncharacterized protein n=1 Tax=Botrytis deweyae TaxID=2478750 RepID=A0ABQ7IX13_9HELO|nr:uncharacterized protein EAE98_002335 [Botrytis deweyae]KAF7936116.1 hypothetical protein EAE98_002335 [Botrytis deweyae]